MQRRKSFHENNWKKVKITKLLSMLLDFSRIVWRRREKESRARNHLRVKLTYDFELVSSPFVIATKWCTISSLVFRNANGIFEVVPWSWYHMSFLSVFNWMTLDRFRHRRNVLKDNSSTTRQNKDPTAGASNALQESWCVQRSDEHRQEGIVYCIVQRKWSANGANLSVCRNTVHRFWDL